MNLADVRRITSLATAELYLTLGHLFRRFEIDPYETAEEMMDWDDYYLPSFRGHLGVALGVEKG